MFAAQECVGGRVPQKLNCLLFHFPQTRPSLGIFLPDAGRLVGLWPFCCCAILTLRREAQQTFAILLVKDLRFHQAIEDRSGLVCVVPRSV